MLGNSSVESTPALPRSSTTENVTRRPELTQSRVTRAAFSGMDCLLSSVWDQFALESLTITHKNDRGRFSDHEQVERKHVVVDVGNGPTGQLDDNIALPHPRSLGWAARHDPGQ